MNVMVLASPPHVPIDPDEMKSVNLSDINCVDFLTNCMCAQDPKWPIPILNKISKNKACTFI